MKSHLLGTSWHCRARQALQAIGIDAKLTAVTDLLDAVRSGALALDGRFEPHAASEPGRPERPQLVSPRELQRRSTATTHGHAALIHAVAHIEFNAINLALDALCRFPGLPAEFYADWLHVAAEEATHFSLLRSHLRRLGHDYGDFPAHDGLWQMARTTALDPLVRMALVPRVLEARGLDVSPAMIRRLHASGDRQGAEIIELILRDEVGHVAIGSRWFRHLCAQRGLDPDPTFERLLAEYDAPRPVLPLNTEARRRAEFSERELSRLEALARGGQRTR
ncbi:MAG: DUF455 family protein [Betaproteobacteria bacterium]|nr:DUF455 family protein [Betaproteobacteria bacterium]